MEANKRTNRNRNLYFVFFYGCLPVNIIILNVSRETLEIVIKNKHEIDIS